MNQLNKLLTDYYTDLYKVQLGLKDYKNRVKERLNEEKSSSYYTSFREINLIKKIINYSFKEKSILVVGAGTGMEVFSFAKLGALVTGIEPNNKALKILNLKKHKHNYKNVIIIKGTAEKLPFKDKKFDFVYCWQVLEHVQNLNKSISEMVRVTKKNGYLFLGFPDYRQIIEPHYKMYLPLFLPKWISKLILILRRRRIGFFNSLQFVNAKKVKKITKGHNLLGIQIIKPKSKKVKNLNSWGAKIKNLIEDYLEIEQNQMWLFKKI